MKNFKKEQRVGLRTGMANVSTYNCLNPDNTELVMRNSEWVNPNMPDFKQENKQVVKTIVQVNREKVRQMKVVKEVEGKSSNSLLDRAILINYIVCNTYRSKSTF